MTYDCHNGIQLKMKYPGNNILIISISFGTNLMQISFIIWNYEFHQQRFLNLNWKYTVLFASRIHILKRSSFLFHSPRCGRSIESKGNKKNEERRRAREQRWPRWRCSPLKSSWIQLRSQATFQRWFQKLCFLITLIVAHCSDLDVGQLRPPILFTLLLELFSPFLFSERECSSR